MDRNVVAESLKLLGLKMKDKVTGFTGMVATVGFDAYGCVQIALTPPMNEKGETPDGRWFDLKRLEDLGDRIMDAPDFLQIKAGSEPGASEKPRMRQ